MREITQCNLCGGHHFKFLFKNHDRMHGVPGEFSLWQCLCGLIFINPQPDEKEIIPYYPAGYAAYGVGGDNSMAGGFIGKLEQVYYSSGSENRFKKILLLPFRPLVRGALVKPGRRLLDMGCGAGTFLEKMKGYGMEVYGVDFSPIAVSRARDKGFNVQGSLKEAGFLDEYFDVIRLNHVFEHLPDPMGILMELRRVLKKDGTMILGVPNVHSLGFKIFGKYWMPLETPRHLFLYSPKTLGMYARRAGLRLVKKSFMSLPGFSLMSLSFWFDKFRVNKRSGRDNRFGRSLFFKMCLFPWTTLLSWTSWADCVEVWLRKE